MCIYVYIYIKGIVENDVEAAIVYLCWGCIGNNGILIVASCLRFMLPYASLLARYIGTHVPKE